jgi:DNA-binding transcriptional LysR family regulator
LWTERRVALLSSVHRLAGRHVVDRTELAGEVIAIWPGTTAAETAHWTGTDLAHHDWLPGPEVRDVAQLTGNVRLGQTIGFAPLSLIGDHLPAGVVAVATTGLSDSELHVVWTTATISPDVARFVRHATEHAAELLVSA